MVKAMSILCFRF